MEKIMVLKVKENNRSRFYEKKSARLFNNDEMQKLIDMTSACINCGCEVKVELKEMQLLD